MMNMHFLSLIFIIMNFLPGFQLGFCYWKLGQKEKIPELYAKIPDWLRMHETYDIFAKRKVVLFIIRKIRNGIEKKFEETVRGKKWKI